MGYTHYWKQGHDDNGYATAYVQACKILFRTDVAIVIRQHTHGFVFNGTNEDRHEDFIIRSSFSLLGDFDFCKTAEKPYDVVAVAVLATLAHYAPKAIEVSSDGCQQDWLAGCKLASDILGVAICVPDSIEVD